MKGLPIALGLVVLCAVPWIETATAQQSAVAPAMLATSAVPNLINYTGVLKDASGRTLTSVSGVTFLLYKDEQGGAPLWLETQNVTPDKLGHYTIELGASSANGIPADLFLSGEPRWLAVQIGNEAEQARVLLVAVPYAMKAADAATIGGLPPSAFVLAAPSAVSGTPTANPNEAALASRSSRATSDVSTTGGTANILPLFTTATNIQNSIVTQTGSGATGKIGINTTTPNATLYVNGATTSNGVLTSPASGTASAAGGKNSQPQDFIASAFNSGSSSAVPQKFQWQAEPAGNDTSTASGTLNLLFASGSATPAETGLKISSKGVFAFAAGQTFPGVADLTANTFTGNQTVTGNITAGGTGNITAAGELQGAVVNATTGFDIGGTRFAFGSAASHNAFMGFAGNSTTTGTYNTASGFEALGFDTTGYENTAIGAIALVSNTTGAYNVAVGQSALSASTSGFANTGVGNSAGGTIDGSVLTGKNNTALGTGASFSTGSLTNASAIGANAVVGESNALVLGGISGVNGQTASVNVGIGTTTPGAALHVIGHSVASGSGLDGTDGVNSSGGNGDPKGSPIGTFGGNGIIATGGTGVFDGEAEYGGDGVGGVFSGGNSGNNDTFGEVFERGTGDGIDVYAGSGQAAYFQGSVHVQGTLSSSNKEFKIDHPMDPANKYLVHASVESSEMMNIYTGNITTDSEGQAMVQLPEWFEALNTDFRYQLTVIGQFAQAIVTREMKNNQFEIGTSVPNVKVSWQVTGVRQDAYAKANPLRVEEEKDARLRGFYIHPELYGAPAEKQIEWARHPQTMKRLQEMKAQKRAAGAGRAFAPPVEARTRQVPSK
jgi:trimeric autotransporter adhesin